MLRYVASRSIRPTWMLRQKSLASTTRLFSKSQSTQNEVVEYCSSHAYAFHDLFQILHDSAPTGMPWAISVLLVAFATRVLSLPFRMFRAKQDRDRRYAFPRLMLQATIVKRQADMRVAAGSPLEEVREWCRKDFERRKAILARQYPYIKMSPPEWFGTRYGAGSLVAGLVAFVNTSTALAMAVSNPAIADACALGDARLLLVPCVAALALGNTAYYRSKIPLPPSTGFFVPREENSSGTVRTVNPFLWSEDEATVILVYILPIFGAGFLQLFPEPVILAVLGNSLWTSLERRIINLYVKMPPGVTDRGLRGARQST